MNNFFDAIGIDLGILVVMLMVLVLVLICLLYTSNYGVTTGDGVIMEGDTGHYIMQRPYYIVPTIDSSDITSDIKSNNRYVLAPISQPVKTLSDYRDTLQISSLLSTSDEAYIKTDVQNMTTYEKEDSDEEGSFQVGVSVTEQVDDDNTTQLV